MRENRGNGKGHGDSNIVISDNGGRVPRAALREAVMTQARNYWECERELTLGVFVAEGVHFVV